MKKIILFSCIVLFSFLLSQTALAQTITIDLNEEIFEITDYSTHSTQDLVDSKYFERHGMPFVGQTPQYPYEIITYGFDIDTIEISELEQLSLELGAHPGIQDAVVFLKELIIEYRTNDLEQLRPIRLVGVLQEKGNRVDGRLRYPKHGVISGIVDNMDRENQIMKISGCPCTIIYKASGNPLIEFEKDTSGVLDADIQNTKIKYFGIRKIKYFPIEDGIELIESVATAGIGLKLEGYKLDYDGNWQSLGGNVFNIIVHEKVHTLPNWYTSEVVLSGNRFAVNNQEFKGQPIEIKLVYNYEEPIEMGMIINGEKYALMVEPEENKVYTPLKPEINIASILTGIDLGDIFKFGYNDIPYKMTNMDGGYAFSSESENIRIYLLTDEQKIRNIIS